MILQASAEEQAPCADPQCLYSVLGFTGAVVLRNSHSEERRRAAMLMGISALPIIKQSGELEGNNYNWWRWHEHHPVVPGAEETAIMLEPTHLPGTYDR